MSWSAVFIRRPVATSLLAAALALPGIAAFFALPIASLPQVEMLSIDVNARLPGASAETVASSVAAPLERALGNIAGVNEMTSSSNKGQTRISLQFDLERDADGAARDVQAAINASRTLLPSGLQSNPTYRKSGPMSIMYIALTSDIYSQPQLYDIAFTLLGQRISQVDGVGMVNVNGSALRSVRVEVNPTVLNQYNVTLEQVRTAIAAANANLPKGFVENAQRRWQIDVNDQAKRASDYSDLIIAWRNAAPIRLKDVAEIKDSVQELRSSGSVNGRPGVVLMINGIPGANLVETTDAIKALIPRLKPLLPAGVEMEVIIDRSQIVRSSLHEVEITLMISIGLVILITFIFLRNARAALIPSIAIPISLLGTLAVIYLCGFSLNNLSLMALIISTGFVVDDAIVVVENTIRHIENGMQPLQAAFKGVKEVSFTVIAMSASLVAVFIPLLFMGGVVGRMFREFSITLASAVVISLIVSLTLTPMLCSQLLKPQPQENSQKNPLATWLKQLFDIPLQAYQRALVWVIHYRLLTVCLLSLVVFTNVYLYTIVPKGFFPMQDTGRIQGYFQGDQNISFWAMRDKVNQFMRIIAEDPDVDAYFENTGGFGGGQSNTGGMNIRLKPRAERDASAQEIVARLRPKLEKIPGATLRLNPQQEFSIGVRPGSAEYQYTLLSNNVEDLSTYIPRLADVLSKLPQLVDVTSDAQDKGLQTNLIVDRDAASRFGITQVQIDTALNNAFGQRLASTIYEPLNQYYVVLTLASEFAQGPKSLDQIYLTTSSNARIPLSTISRWELQNTPLSINHEGQFAAATISFNIAPGYALDAATQAIEEAFSKLNPPDSIHGAFSGKAKAFKASLDSQPWLILTALITIYIVLGILYESTIHPITIISTLPSAGIGALLALLLFKSELTIIAMIGIILLIGIVMKNAIMMIDAAQLIEKEQGLTPEQAIQLACSQRFRPILMTTFAAVLGALPLLLGVGDGAEIRQPLGISIVGGLILGQILTLFTTPVVYIYLERLRLRLQRVQSKPTSTSTLLSSS